ncbi:hypothetical protein AB0D97_12570 [Streptomyces roseus]|uniref:hypothetical protein n=1 Tax=Streptomyces roseus TaxID=66430 RepID=UPI0033CA1171
MHSFDDYTPARTGQWQSTPLHLIQRGIAYHEAGHTVLGLLAGFACEYTRVHTIDVGQANAIGWTGSTRWAPSFGTFLDVAVASGAAGQAADVHHLRESGRLTPETARAARADHDKTMVINLLEAAGCPIVEAGPAPGGGLAWDQVMAHAERLVEQEWRRITVVAEAILAAPDFTLSGDEAARLIGA